MRFGSCISLSSVLIRVFKFPVILVLQEQQYLSRKKTSRGQKRVSGVSFLRKVSDGSLCGLGLLNKA